MDQAVEKNKKNSTNAIVLPFFVIANILVYALKGVKACFYDLWIMLYQAIGFQLNKSSFKSLGNDVPAENDIVNDDFYERTKNKVKKEKVYKYSDKYLQQLETEKALLKDDLQNAGSARSKEAHVYQYIVKEPNGKITKGTMTGFSKLDVNSFLLNEGYEVYSIKTSKWIDFVYKESGSFSFGGKKMKTKDLIFWLTQLSTYLKAGIKLNDAVRILTNQMKGNKNRQKAFLAISYELTLGESFSASLEKQDDMFPPLLINMLKAAEASGTLIETLDDMANYYTEINNTKKQMISAMTYPTIITFFAMAVVVFILTYVVPQFTEIYESYNAEINGFTLFVINASTFLKNNILLLLLIFILIVIGIVIGYKTVKAFRASFQIFLMHIPIVKDVIIYNELTIFTKTFSSLLRNNVFITDSMDILSKITNNEVYKAILYRTINNIVKGEKISEAFKDHWAIPDVAYFMIVTGESTGQLADMMQKVSEYYQEMHRSIINNLKAFIEPIMITLLALIVGVIIIAVIIPMFGMYNTISY